MADQTLTTTDLSRVTFEVTVPAETPATAEIHVCGDAPALGSWSARGLSLESVGERRYRGAAFLATSAEFSFKITRGNWNSVEKTRSGAEIGNRHGCAKKKKHYEIEVEDWADEPGKESPSGKVSVKGRRKRSHSGRTKSRKKTRSKRVRTRGTASSVCPGVQLFGSYGLATTEEDRSVWVHLPHEYDEKGSKTYPVLYMLDGQNVFDPRIAFMGRSWRADLVADELEQEGKIEPFIIVAIAHRMNRSYEYTPVKDYFFEGGGLDSLADLIEKEIHPALVKRYRVRDDAASTGIMGSSLGGLAAFHMAWRHPDRFGLSGVISPSLWWAGRYTLKMVSQSRRKPSNTRFWIDMGRKESRFPKRLVNSVIQLSSLLRSRGYTVRHYIDKDGVHDEPSWNKRLHLPFQHLFPPPRH